MTLPNLDKKTARVIIIIAVMFVLMGATSIRNGNRAIKSLDVKILDDEHLLITHEMISAMMSKKIGSYNQLQKREVDLTDLEHLLNTNDMVQYAQASLSVDGKLDVVIRQREPIARILDGESSGYYLDSEGFKMPLSRVFSSRIPVVTGITSNDDLKTLHPLALYLQHDEFFKKLIVGISLKSGKYYLEMRSSNVEVAFGDLQAYQRKLFNLKVFYQKAIRDNILKSYSRINLEFTNQVVCTKR